MLLLQMSNVDKGTAHRAAQAVRRTFAAVVRFQTAVSVAPVCRWQLEAKISAHHISSERGAHQ
jgi:hypothetical protein